MSVSTYEAPCSCGANDWERRRYEDTNLMAMFRCKQCGDVMECE